MNFRNLLKPALIAGIFCCAAFSVFAQGAYVKIGGGYNVGIGSQFGQNAYSVTSWNQDNNGFQTKEDVKRVRVNFGKGFTGSAAFGYMFTEQLGAEIEVGYLIGGKNNTSYQDIFNPDPEQSRQGNSEMYARMATFQPSLVMAIKLSENLNLQSKFGIVTGKGTIFVNDSRTSGGFAISQEAEYKGGWGFGLQGALGLDYKLNGKYAVFSEIKMSNLSYAPTKYKLTKVTVNGVEEPYLPEHSETSLENSYTNEDFQRKVTLKYPFTFSTVGLQVGIKYNF